MISVLLLSVAACGDDEASNGNGNGNGNGSGNGSGSLMEAVQRFCRTTCNFLDGCGFPTGSESVAACINECETDTEPPGNLRDEAACRSAIDATVACFDRIECSEVTECSAVEGQLFAACAVEGGNGSGVEAEDVSVSSGAVVRSGTTPAAFRVSYPNGSTLIAQTFSNAAQEACDDLDTVLLVLDSSGQVIAGNDDFGGSFCARVEVSDPGPVRVEVTEFFDDAEDFEIRFSLQ
jgi:hypothetical protein